jgi:site-specific DNA-methyltransferase (adenine-specific)
LPEKSEPLLVVGGKPLWLMRELVKDYSRPGELVADCCAGGATTLIAASLEGRRAIGAELDPDTFAKAQTRIAYGNAGLRSPNQQQLFPSQEPGE